MERAKPTFFFRLLFLISPLIKCAYLITGLNILRFQLWRRRVHLSVVNISNEITL